MALRKEESEQKIISIRKTTSSSLETNRPSASNQDTGLPLLSWVLGINPLRRSFFFPLVFCHIYCLALSTVTRKTVRPQLEGKAKPGNHWDILSLQHVLLPFPLLPIPYRVGQGAARGVWGRHGGGFQFLIQLFHSQMKRRKKRL